MALKYLVDTSVLTRLSKPAVAARLIELEPTGIARAPITDLEIGFSARNGAEWDTLMEAVAAFAEVELAMTHVDRARRVQRLLANAGLKGRKIPDLLVAAVAEAEGLVVLHHDADFDHIASVTGQPVEWVVAPGSID